MKEIYLGKIVNTHGLKGELRMLSSFKYKDRVLVPGFKIYIGKKREEEVIVSFRHHKQFEMFCLKGYTNINEVLKYKGLSVYIKREDLKLGENEYLNEDLLGLEVYSAGKLVGICRDVVEYPSSEMLVIRNKEKKFLVPYVVDLVKEINLEEKRIVIEDRKGLIE